MFEIEYTLEPVIIQTAFCLAYSITISFIKTNISE